LGEEQHFDPCRGPPTLFILDAEFVKCVGKRFAQTQAIEKCERRAMRILWIDSGRQAIDDAPAEYRTP
jgi:hypothetical protein